MHSATQIIDNAKMCVANTIALNLICFCNLTDREIESDGYYRVRGTDICPDGLKTYLPSPNDEENVLHIETMVVREYDGFFIFCVEEEDFEFSYDSATAEMLVDISDAVEKRIYELKYGKR